MNPTNNLSYLDAGFDQFLSRVPENNRNSISSLEFDNFTDDLSASKVQGGVMSTNDGQTELNLEQGFFMVKQSDVQLVRFGRLEDGTVGISMKNQDGNSLIFFNGEQSVLSSGNGVTTQNFEEGTFEVKDDQGRTVVFLGKQVGGF